MYEVEQRIVPIKDESDEELTDSESDEFKYPSTSILIAVELFTFHNG